jgi:hypothetical protein
MRRRRAPYIRPPRRQTRPLVILPPVQRQAAPSPNNNTKADILRRFGDEVPCDVGSMDDVCSSCGALHWKEERSKIDLNHQTAQHATCCQKGAVELPVDYAALEYPLFLRELLEGTDASEAFSSFSPVYIS